MVMDSQHLSVLLRIISIAICQNLIHLCLNPHFKCWCKVIGDVDEYKSTPIILSSATFKP